MDVLSSVVNWIVSLGASVFLPIVMFIIGIIFGMKPGKAFKAGVMLGIAFTAISALNSALLSGTIAPVAQTAMENSGTGLEFIDVLNMTDQRCLRKVIDLVTQHARQTDSGLAAATFGLLLNK